MRMSEEHKREANMENVSTLTTGAIDSNMERVKLRNLSEVGRVARRKRWEREQEQLERCELRFTLEGPAWAIDALADILHAPGAALHLRHLIGEAISTIIGAAWPVRVAGGMLTRKRNHDEN